MNKLIIAIVPAVALLVGCSKVPLNCESPEAKSVVQQIVRETTKIPRDLYNVTFEQVMTQSVNDKKEQSCKATVSYVLSDEAKNTLLEASNKLDASINISDEGFPYTKYLPDATDVTWYAGMPSREESAIVNLLGGTDYPVRLQDYLVNIARNQNHPHHMGYLVYASQLDEVYKMSKFTIENYKRIETIKHRFDIEYVTTIVKVDGKEEYYTKAVVPGQVRAAVELDSLYHTVAKKLVDLK